MPCSYQSCSSSAHEILVDYLYLLHEISFKKYIPIIRVYFSDFLSISESYLAAISG